MPSHAFSITPFHVSSESLRIACVLSATARSPLACYKSGVQPRTALTALFIILFVGVGARNSAQTQSAECGRLRKTQGG
jgi:hypothetical protein